MSVCIVFGSGPYNIVGWILVVKTLRVHLYGMKERDLILVMKYRMFLLALPNLYVSLLMREISFHYFRCGNCKTCGTCYSRCSGLNVDRAISFYLYPVLTPDALP